jgi:hypothetical protein
MNLLIKPEKTKEKYTFIHPTKSGGSAVEHFLKTYYNDHIIAGKGHGIMCSNTNNPILIVRDVKSRFFSMFNYLKNGSNKFNRDNEFKNKYESYTILDFIHLLKNNKKELYNGFTWNQHFDNTTAWIKNTRLNNIIIIRYTDDLNPKIQQLINYLGIPNKNVPLSKINVSFKKKEDVEFMNHPEVNAFIQEYFKPDIQLIHLIQHNPQLFKLVL